MTTLADSVRALEDEVQRLRGEQGRFMGEAVKGDRAIMRMYDNMQMERDIARAELEQCKRDLDGWRTDAQREAGLAKRYYEEAEQLRDELEQAKRELKNQARWSGEEGTRDAAIIAKLRATLTQAMLEVCELRQQLSGVTSASGPAGSAVTPSSGAQFRPDAQPAGPAAPLTDKDTVRIGGQASPRYAGKVAHVLRILPNGTLAECRVLGDEMRRGEAYPAFPVEWLERVEPEPTVAPERDYLAEAEGELADYQWMDWAHHILAHLRQQQGKGAAPEEERLKPSDASPLPWRKDGQQMCCNARRYRVVDACGVLVARVECETDAEFIVAAANRANGGGGG